MKNMNDSERVKKAIDFMAKGGVSGKKSTKSKKSEPSYREAAARRMKKG